MNHQHCFLLIYFWLLICIHFILKLTGAWQMVLLVIVAARPKDSNGTSDLNMTTVVTEVFQLILLCIFHIFQGEEGKCWGILELNFWIRTEQTWLFSAFLRELRSNGDLLRLGFWGSFSQIGGGRICFFSIFSRKNRSLNRLLMKITCPELFLGLVPAPNNT